MVEPSLGSEAEETLRVERARATDRRENGDADGGWVNRGEDGDMDFRDNARRAKGCWLLLAAEVELDEEWSFGNSFRDARDAAVPLTNMP